MAISELTLYERLPASALRTLPRTALGTFPTPVQSLVLATAAGDCPILVKRDDLCADGYAGNKIRKLEFLLADAAERGSRRLSTAGAAGSHHAFATAYHGIAQGFDVSLVLFPQTRTSHVRTMLQLDRAAGAEMRWASRMEAVPYGLWRARLAHRRDRPCVIPPGGSNAVGTAGYVNAALELASQIEAGDVAAPSSIHVAAGTLGTVAGLAIGLAWAGLDVPIIATRITPLLVTNERSLAALVQATHELLTGVGAVLPTAADALRLVDLRHDHFGDSSGRATDAGNEATRIFANAGLQLDPTYTAKAAATLLCDIATGSGGAQPLFWHTLSANEPTELLERDTLPPLPAPFARYLDPDTGRDHE
ncbi:D-cysteine desulfhydrase [soil metagenome]